MGAAPTGNAANPFVFLNLQESLKLRSMPLMAGSFLDIFRYDTAGTEQSWFSKPVLGSVLALVATLLVVEQVSSTILFAQSALDIRLPLDLGCLPEQEGAFARSEMDHPGHRQICGFHES